MYEWLVMPCPLAAAACLRRGIEVINTGMLRHSVGVILEVSAALGLLTPYDEMKC